MHATALTPSAATPTTPFTGAAADIDLLALGAEYVSARACAEKIIQTPARTLSGLRMKALLLDWRYIAGLERFAHRPGEFHFGSQEIVWREPDTRYLLADSILSDLLWMAGATVGGPIGAPPLSPMEPELAQRLEQPLLALGEQLAEAIALCEALCDDRAHDDDDEQKPQAFSAAAKISENILDTRARTLEGLKVKVRAFHWSCDDCLERMALQPGEPHHGTLAPMVHEPTLGDLMADSILRDLAALAGLA